MRLTEFERETIKNLAHRHFGADTEVFLFGSRTKDIDRGGDIDLFIRNSYGTPLTILEKINFLAELTMQIGEQKIDVVLDNVEARNSGFYKTIYQTGIQLC